MQTKGEQNLFQICSISVPNLFQNRFGTDLEQMEQILFSPRRGLHTHPIHLILFLLERYGSVVLFFLAQNKVVRGGDRSN